jgi:glycosyltransferase involved in cell wall biosynthesis
VRVRFTASASRLGLSGGGRLRSYWPAEALAGSGWDSVATRQWPEDADVVVSRRALTSSGLVMHRKYQQAGIRVLVDVDDELERVPRQNQWTPTPQTLRRQREVIEEADGLTVTSDRLQEVYGQHAKRTWIVHNYLPEWVDPENFPGVSDGRVRVGWAGRTVTHRQDLTWLAPVAREAFRGALFTTIGDTRTPKWLGLERGKYEAFSGVGDPKRYYKQVARADIVIVPLDNGENRDFNTSKSWLHTLEGLALGKPVVATDLPEHRKLLSGTGAGLLASTPQDMAEMVQALVHDSSLRAEMTEAATELGRSLALERHLDEWTVPLNEIVERVAA